jgi:hypothetical protein
MADPLAERNQPQHKAGAFRREYLIFAAAKPSDRESSARGAREAALFANVIV